MMLKMALGFLAVFVPLQIFLGDLQGLNTRHHQPAKLAAIEGSWQTAAPAPLTLFGIPDHGRSNACDDAIEVPYLGSLILTHSLDGGVQGLNDFPADQRPPVWPVFFAFRLMVAIGLAMLGIVALGLWLLWRGRLFATDWFLRICQWAAPLGFLAVLAGWTVTEVGRQPWTVYGLLRTAQFGHALADRTRRAGVAAGLHGALPHDVSRRLCGAGSPGPPGLCCGRRAGSRAVAALQPTAPFAAHRRSNGHG